MNHEEWISERAMSAAVVSISSMFLLLFKLLLCQTWCVFCSISHQMFDISEEELDLVLGKICSNSDTNDIDPLGGTVASVFVLNWYIDIVNILVIQFTVLGRHLVCTPSTTSPILSQHLIDIQSIIGRVCTNSCMCIQQRSMMCLWKLVDPQLAVDRDVDLVMT